MYIIVPKENIVKLSELEQNGAVMAMSLIFVSFLSRVIPLMGRITGHKKNNTQLSGIILGGLTVQVVAFCTDFLMAFFPTPVMIDPVLGTRVHVLRWCEWFPCATFMTFMMEGADLYWKPEEGEGNGPPPDFIWKKYLHAITQGLAVFLGLLFPFCPGYWTWMLCMVVSCAAYLTNFPRLWGRRKELPKALRNGATVEEAERINSAKIALRLRYVCTAVWSIIVAIYFVSSVIGPKFAPEGSLLRSPAANMVCECFFDVLSKVLFLITIVDVHYAIFDPFARTERRLEELRQLMSAVWESSSDVIAISVRTGPKGGASTLLSPAFFGLGGSSGPLRRLSCEEIKDLFKRKSVLFQLTQDSFQTHQKDGEDNSIAKSGDLGISEPKLTADQIFNIEYTGFSTLIDKSGGSVAFDKDEIKAESGALRAVADSVVKAWTINKRDHVFTHDLKWVRKEDGKEVVIRTEAKVSRLDENALIVIVRDISERVKVFETEKQILFETTSRQKDAEANRFTRHEVKNGLLAAIGLYESLCDAQRSQLTKDRNQTVGIAGMRFDIGDGDDGDVVRCMNELGKSLHETLDTIMTEAMARDLVHDLYRPHRERVQISSVLGGFGDAQSLDFNSAGNLTRFPLITRPCPLPQFYFDPQLLRYVHRQALSNACKYGKTGEVVLTEIIFDEKEMRLKINVINMPGEYHEMLLELGEDAESAVFTKGVQIHERFANDAGSIVTKKSEAASLPGDGGWIIQRCAKIMKGRCSIKFEETRTVFTLDVPAKPWGSEQIRTPIDIKTFRFPENIWGIGIDDSKIQQKLLGKFFEFAGVSRDRIKVFGKDSEEIVGFVSFVVNFMDEHMGEPVLMIADENLDVLDEASRHQTISGSQLVENIRQRLLPEQERQLFALIRSANDSSSDVAIYKARAHGFLPKAPIKKANVLETLAPLWIARYPQKKTGDDDSTSMSRRRSDSFSSLESSSSLNDAVATTPVEILLIVNEIDKLFSTRSILQNWEMIWDKLHALKGDLLTLQVGSKVISAVGMINSFRDLNSDEDLTKCWNLLREHIASMVSS